jgi:hypothetical protein
MNNDRPYVRRTAVRWIVQEMGTSSAVNLFMEETKVDSPASVNADDQMTEEVQVRFSKPFGDDGTCMVGGIRDATLSTSGA